MKKTGFTIDKNRLVGESKSHRLDEPDNRLARLALGVGLLVFAIVLSACASAASTPTQAPAAPAAVASQPTAATTATVQQPASTPTQATIPTSTSAPQQAAANTSLDPCQLISSQEASTLTGASFGQGKEVTTSGGMKICTYGAQTTNVFNAEVIQAPDTATAEADQAQFLADIQANLKNLTDQGMNVTQVPSFADGAVMSNINFSYGGITYTGNAMGFRKGVVFFGFSDLVVGGKAPSDSAMQAEASTVLGRLP